MAPTAADPEFPAAPVPALLVTGAHPAARGRAIDWLLACRPESERWAIAVAAPALTAGVPQRNGGVECEVIATGCPCCSGLLPFRVGVARLLRRMRTAPPALLLVDAGPTAHLDGIRHALLGPHFAGLLRLAATVAAAEADTPGFTTSRAAECDAVPGLADFVLTTPGPERGTVPAGSAHLRHVRVGDGALVASDAAHIIRQLQAMPAR